nr:MAG TPA: hypothetical protein [Caudoviricetes sp.]
MSRHCRDARCRGGHLDTVGDAGGTVTPPHNSEQHKHQRKRISCFMMRISSLTLQIGRGAFGLMAPSR